MSVLGELKELWKYRELLLSMVKRELRIRYKNSVFGFFWSLLNPLITVIVMTLVFKYIMRIQVPNYSAYILAAYLPFTFFQMGLMDSSQSILSSMQLIRKVYFPREILPLTMVLSNFIHLLLALGVFFLYLLVIYMRNPQISPFQPTIVYLPLLLLVNLFLVTGFSLLISAYNVFYEDVKYFVGIILYLLFFLCPVMYFSEQVSNIVGEGAQQGSWVGTVYHLNPVAMMVTAYRKVLLAPQNVLLGGTEYRSEPLNWGLFWVTAVFSVFILWLGYRSFNRLKWRFVERM